MSEPKKKFYITTPIYYVNDKPHIGSTYTTVVADVMARHYRQVGNDVFFLTGTDENSQKNVDAAAKLNKDVQSYTDEMASTWRETWLNLGLTFDRFIRTTSAEHEKAVLAFFEKVNAQGDIYQGDYEGLYCVGCEAFKAESDLDEEGNCPDHKKKPEVIKEQNYFFKLTKYRDKLLQHIEEHPEFIQPEKRRNEVVSYIKDFMTDVSISRQAMEWGIRLPIDESHAMYVWFDALINYLSGVGFAQDEIKFGKYWPADVHLVGKDIFKFHCAMWPAMLMSAGLPLPKTIFVHGFFTVNGDKMSKSLGNAIDPLELKKEYPFDVIRYFLLREFPFGDDGDFSLDRLRERYNSDLANDLGNLTQRTLNMVAQYLDGTVHETHEFKSPIDTKRIQEYTETFKFDRALQGIWDAISWSNKLIEDSKPWELAKTGETEKVAEVLSQLVIVLKDIAEALVPFMPETAEKMNTLLSREQLSAPEEPLFPRKQ